MGPLRAARNAAGAVGRAIGAAIRGETVLAPQDVLQARLAVCRDGVGLPADQVRDGHCDRYEPAKDRCAACGCGLGAGPGGLPGKASLATERCPLGRWPS